MFLRLYNLRAVSQSVSGQTTNVLCQLCFHLHGGTSYGRGLCKLPSDSPDLQALKRVLEDYSEKRVSEEEVNDGTLLEVWYTPPGAVGGVITKDICSVRTCGHTLREVSLAQVKRSTAPAIFHICAQVKSYQPQKLYQCLKIFCPQCKTIKEVPDDESIAQVFQEALRDSRQACFEPWAVTSSVDCEELGRTFTIHGSVDLVLDNALSQLLFLEGLTMDEMYVISSAFKNTVPVWSEEGRMRMLHFPAPFLFCGDKSYYGCNQCSRSCYVDPDVFGVEVWDKHNVAKVLGVQLMEYVLLMKFELEDETGTIEAFLWEDAEKFFHVSSDEISASQELQDKVKNIMDRLQPPGSNLEERPFLELCLSSYNVEESGETLVCYQITNTEAREHFEASPGRPLSFSFK